MTSTFFRFWKREGITGVLRELASSEGLNDEYVDHVETMYPGGLDYLFTKTPDEIWDFFRILFMIYWSLTILERPLVTPLPTLI